MDRSRLSEFYGLNIWPMDPDTEEGKARFRVSLEKFRNLVKHDYFKELLSKPTEISILEVCGGSGVGGCALAKILEENGYKVSILVTDIREEDLEKAAKWIGPSKNIVLKTKAIDALEIYRLGETFDIVLMYGLSTPHFNPWTMSRFLAGASQVLSEKGILIIEEADRRFFIFYIVKYKDLITGKTLDNKIYFDVHTGYDPVRGVFKRTYTVIPGPPKLIDMESYLWGVAEISTLAWMFFKDIDVLRYDRNYFVLATKPRRKIAPEDLGEDPRALKKA